MDIRLREEESIFNEDIKQARTDTVEHDLKSVNLATFHEGTDGEHVVQYNNSKVEDKSL